MRAVAGPDAAAGAVGASEGAGGQPHPQDAGRREHQAGGAWPATCWGRGGPGHAAGDHRRRERARSPWRTWRDSGCGRRSRSCRRRCAGRCRSTTGSCWGCCWRRWSSWKGTSGRLGAQIGEVLPPPFAEAIGRLETVPGIDRRAAENIVAEVGPRPEAVSKTTAHVASWVGICPGNLESTGRRRSGRTTKGNAWPRVTLVQCAWAVSHTKGTYLSSHYKRLAAQFAGEKRALLALGHTLLGIVYAVLKKRTTYQEWAPTTWTVTIGRG